MNAFRKNVSLNNFIFGRFDPQKRFVCQKLLKRSNYISNYVEYCKTRPLNRALVSSLSKHLLPTKYKRDKIRFSNFGIAQHIPRALNELGYSVDIISFDDMDFIPKKNYDLFIGHGGINFEQLSRALPNHTTQIYFSTGIYWKEFNQKEARRIYDLACRKGYLLNPDRAIIHDEEYANQKAHGIIVLGNQNAVNSYHKFPVIFGINNAVYPVDWNGNSDKDFDAGRKHFLFFSGSGSIHKGLDLLIEAFKGLDLHLHICQGIDPDFMRVYKAELTQQENIHLYGKIPMRSSEFESLVMKCNWVISATACEGQPGATLECMAYGLIPILTIESNIDIKNLGFLLYDSSVSQIRQSVIHISETEINVCRDLSERNIKKIDHSYSPMNFITNFITAVKNIIMLNQ